jgi:hypothetical protein
MDEKNVHEYHGHMVVWKINRDRLGDLPGIPGYFGLFTKRQEEDGTYVEGHLLGEFTTLSDAVFVAKTRFHMMHLAESDKVRFDSVVDGLKSMMVSIDDLLVVAEKVVENDEE